MHQPPVYARARRASLSLLAPRAVAAQPGAAVAAPLADGRALNRPDAGAAGGQGKGVPCFSNTIRVYRVYMLLGRPTWVAVAAALAG